MTELTLLRENHKQDCESDLHEHAEAGFEQVREASGHVFNVGAFESVRVEDFLQDLPQERVIGRLQNTTPKKKKKPT